ncbi:hypothetical protein Tco_0957023 [Tanacetum coccineum]
MKTAESTKGEALVELEKANNALKELTNKLQACLRNANSEEHVETRRLDETSEVVNGLRDQLKDVRDVDMDVIMHENLEVEEAKK